MYMLEKNQTKGHRATVITIANHKGGVGKTTTAASIGTILAGRGYKVLLVDLDAQANLTCSLMSQSEVGDSIYDALTASDSGVLPVYHLDHLNDDLDIVPATLQLAQADLELSSVMARETLLRELLEARVVNDYDFIIIDCPPSLGLMTLNAATATDYVIIPLVAEVLPFVGLTMMNNFLSMVRKKLNPNLDILGILITRYERTNLSRQIEDGLRAELGSKVFQTRIRKNITLAQAPLEKSGIVSYDAKSNGAADYNTLVDEILGRIK